jgi:hypothetical protein
VKTRIPVTCPECRQANRRAAKAESRRDEILVQKREATQALKESHVRNAALEARIAELEAQ